jgi:hypothetical protein
MRALTLEQKKRLVKNLGKYFAIGNSMLVLGVVVLVLVKLL